MAQRISHPTLAAAQAAGDSSSGCTLRAGWQAVRASWQSEQLMTAQSQARMLEIGDRFVRRLEADGLCDWAQVSAKTCAAFVGARTRRGDPPSPGTMHLRRSTVRAVFRCLRSQGLVVGDPTLDLHLPPRSPAPVRPLTDDEVVLGRASTRMGTTGSRTLLRAVAWALGEATAGSSEIAAVRLSDLDDLARPRRVRLGASRRYDAREGELSPWGSAVVARHAIALRAAGASPDALLAYGGAGAGGAYLAQASVCTGIARVLDLAGLREDPAVKPGSLRGWAGARLHRDGLPLEVVAARLGCRSLDATAAEIGLVWRHPRVAR